MATISRCSPDMTAREGPIGEAKPGRVPTEWPQLVGVGYFAAHQIICTERPDVYIEENPAGAIIPPGPRDEQRVRVFIDGLFQVAPPAPVVG